MGPPSYVCWFTTPSKYSYLRIIHVLHNIFSYLHQLSVHELGPHPVTVYNINYNIIYI